MDEVTPRPAAAQDETGDGQLALLRSLASESAEKLERLRRVQIPQHVGMAAAGRALAIDLPKALVAQVQAGLTSGALGQRWEAALKRAGAEGEDGPAATLTVLATLLIEQAQRAGHYLASRAEEWASDAYRLEGQASALEDQVRRLEQARDGITRSFAEGSQAAARQEQRRRERDAGLGPGHEEDDGDDA